MCRHSKEGYDAFRLALDETEGLSSGQKKLIIDRYLNILETFERRANLYAIIFHTCRFIVTVGSLIVPALLSIQYVDTGTTSNVMDPGNFSFQIYWSTWVISLLVTTSNGIATLFKVEKKYYLLHTILEQLRSEGWQFLELSGRFSGFYTPQEKPTHGNQFLYFCHAVEKLKMKQVEEEYYKSTEANLHGATITHANGNKHGTAPDIETGKKNTVIPQVPAFFSDGLIPPTPLNPQLQQLLQALTVEGSNGPKQHVVSSAAQESSTEMSVRPEVQGKPAAKESILRQSSVSMPKTESTLRVGTEIPAESLEQRPTTQENT